MSQLLEAPGDASPARRRGGCVWAGTPGGVAGPQDGDPGGVVMGDPARSAWPVRPPALTLPTMPFPMRGLSTGCSWVWNARPVHLSSTPKPASHLPHGQSPPGPLPPTPPRQAAPAVSVTLLREVSHLRDGSCVVVTLLL